MVRLTPLNSRCTVITCISSATAALSVRTYYTFRPRKMSTVSAHRRTNRRAKCRSALSFRLRRGGTLILLARNSTDTNQAFIPNGPNRFEPISRIASCDWRASPRGSFDVPRGGGIAPTGIPPAVLSLSGNPCAKVNFRDTARRIARRRIFPFLCTL